MFFNSFDFLVFFPIVVLVYFLFPHRIRHVWLLISSYYFYMCWNAKYALLILFSTVITYASGLLLEKVRPKRKRLIMALCVISNLAVLGYFKYFNFIIDSLNSIILPLGGELNIPSFDILLPVGISFYTFQALGYIIDVYRGKTAAERNFFMYALFVSFFPQLVAGPIERSKDLLTQLKERHYFSMENTRDGLMLMLWGFFMKVVLGDRIAVVVDAIYANPEERPGFYLVIAAILFMIQIYCDFGGYSTIALGAAKVMGFKLTDNFESPFFSRSIAEFWRRWHVTLATWFKDYVYISLGGNRKGRIRQFLNGIIVFTLSGLWHGAAWTYVVWGFLNGLYQVAGALTKPLRDKLVCWLKLNRESFSHKLYQAVTTFLLVVFSCIFFRADNMTMAWQVIDSILHADNIHIIADGSLYTLGLSMKSYLIMEICIIVLLVVDGLKYRGICVREFIFKQELWFRWMIYIASVLFILIFGMWGSAYNAHAFIYFQF